MWIWRKAGRGPRIAAGVLLVAAIAVGVALAPSISGSKQDRAEVERRERADARARLVRRLRAEQRPRSLHSDATAPAGAAPGRRLAARAAMMADLSAAIASDARERVRRGELDGPIRRAECEPFPRSVDGVGADDRLSRRRGRYACVAVTTEFKRGDATSVGGVIGHPYRALVDFDSGRIGFCKISGQAGPSREQLVTVPDACGGR